MDEDELVGGACLLFEVVGEAARRGEDQCAAGRSGPASGGKERSDVPEPVQVGLPDGLTPLDLPDREERTRPVVGVTGGDDIDLVRGAT